MHASRTVGRTYCTKTIIHISQNKRGVAATLVYTYVGLKYVNNVVATIVHRYYFMINIAMFHFTKQRNRKKERLGRWLTVKYCSFWLTEN